jgi:hypothetical protein
LIYAKLDVCMATHPKFIAAGAAATGYWCAALAYIRGHDLPGILPHSAITVPLASSLDSARTFLDKLVEVGLFAPHAAGWELIGYHAKNESQAAISHRKAHDSARKRTERAAVKMFSMQTCPRVSEPGLQPGVPDSDSVVVKILDPGVQGGPVPAESNPLVKPETPMSSACAAIVETVRMAKGRIADPYGEWLKFAGHYAGKLRESELVGRWQKWLVRASELQQRELATDKQRNASRDKNYRSAAEAAADVGYTAPPRAATAASRRRQQEYEAQAIPIPKDVLEAFSKLGTGTPN